MTSYYFSLQNSSMSRFTNSKCRSMSRPSIPAESTSLSLPKMENSRSSSRLSEIEVSFHSMSFLYFLEGKDILLFRVKIRPLQEFAFLIWNSLILFLTKKYVFRIPTLEHCMSVQAHAQQANCLAIAFNRDGSKMAIGGADGLCSIWNTEQIICERTLSRYYF